MSIGQRVREVRESSGLNLREFSTRIGITSASVSLIENEKNGVSDQTVRSICREFGVNETWLRTGSGEMRAAQSREQEMAALFKRLMADSPESFRAALVSTLLRFDPDGPEWAVLEKIYEDVAREYGRGGDPEK